MITSHIVDRAKFEEATNNHLSLLRLSFDKVRSYSEQYEICTNARKWYGNHPTVAAMEDDLKYSEKPKF